MKITFLLTNILLFLCIGSCSTNNNPTNSNQSLTFMGNIESQRFYTLTERWFIQNTDSPYVVVPDSLTSSVSLIDSLRKEGVVQIIQQIESIEPLDSSYYVSLHLPLPKSMYKSANTATTNYSLFDELQALSSHHTYSLISGFGSETWYETNDHLEQIFTTSLMKPGLSWVKKPLEVNQEWIRWQMVDTLTGNVEIQKSLRVLGIQSVTVKAGTFSAYKLALFTNNNPSSNEYEYWVPNIGLILYEDDRFETVPPTYMTFARKIIRRELTSANVIQ